MSTDLLRQIAASHLPITFHRPDDIDRVRALCAAGSVIALVPSLSAAHSPAEKATPAQVLAVTQRGLEELADFSYPAPPQDTPKPWLSSRIAALVSARGWHRGAYQRP